MLGAKQNFCENIVGAKKDLRSNLRIEATLCSDILDAKPYCTSYDTSVEHLFKHFGSETRLLYKHFGCKKDYCSNISDAKEDFCSNILGVKQDFCSNVSDAK